MTAEFTRGPAWAARDGNTLAGEMSYRPDGKKPTHRVWPRAMLDPVLAAWFSEAAEKDRVEVLADIDGEGRVLRVRMAHPPRAAPPSRAAPKPRAAQPERAAGRDAAQARPAAGRRRARAEVRPDPARLAAVGRHGGGANPYTFIPAPPREGLPPGLGDSEPAPHGVIDPASQWSGWLVLHLVARTPLLLPDPEHARCGTDQHPTYPVRTGPDGMPLLHGASVKGALRSAYETVTASRFGVFRGHDVPLAYRQPASRPDVTPARVEADGRGGLRFRLCRGTLPVPLYDKPGQVRPRRKARAMGRAGHLVRDDHGIPGWCGLHGAEVWYTTRPAGRGRRAVDTVALVTDPAPAGAAGRGWLSVTGRSIETKASERLFIPGKETVPVEKRHHALWHAVLASYQDAARRHEPMADSDGRTLSPSRHVPAQDGTVPGHLAEGDLVYLKLARPSTPGNARGGRGAGAGGRGRAEAGGEPGAPEVTAIQPVMIGRMPYARSPAEALDDSLHPAARLEDLSPADRLFGWAPSRPGPGRRSASGYRGRLRVESVRCHTTDWLVNHEKGVTLAPLGSPQPSQFRFYAAADEDGTPARRGAHKDGGYNAGLRGRKAYWYPSSTPEAYWQPGTGQVDGRFREWQQPPGAKPSQTATHLGWVREDTEFTVRLFLDAVPGTELGPLIWLASQEGCALRLGAGKPYGFGAVSAAIDWEATQLRTGDALRGCWLSLERSAPAPREQVEALAAEFSETAAPNAVLGPAAEAWRKTAQGLRAPIHYPRSQPEPEAETYRWFVANEQIRDRETAYGFALPHVLEEDQRLPYLRPSRGTT